MAKEIERKFLVAGDDWRRDVTESVAIRQAYPLTSDGRSLRVRLYGDGRAKITIKVGISNLSRHEFEYEIPTSDAEEMIALSASNVLEKTRHNVPYHGFLWEVDVYHGAYEGLIVAEVELHHESSHPDLPPWLGREVTGDPSYSNQSLAERSFGVFSVDGLQTSL
jgi:CYTH domain-containing protein